MISVHPVILVVSLCVLGIDGLTGDFRESRTSQHDDSGGHKYESPSALSAPSRHYNHTASPTINNHDNKNKSRTFDSDPKTWKSSNIIGINSSQYTHDVTYDKYNTVTYVHDRSNNSSVSRSHISYDGNNAINPVNLTKLDEPDINKLLNKDNTFESSFDRQMLSESTDMLEQGMNYLTESSSETIEYKSNISKFPTFTDLTPTLRDLAEKQIIHTQEGGENKEEDSLHTTIVRWKPYKIPLHHRPYDAKVTYQGVEFWGNQRYLVSVFVPIGIGILGAASIVFVAVILRSFRRKKRMRMVASASRNLLRPQYPQIDHAMLLDEMSDDGF